MEGSGRSSFSARFFARSNAISGTPVSSVQIASSPAAVEQRSVSKTHALLQDDDLDNNPGRLLAAERERLKLRERQVCQRKQAGMPKKATCLLAPNNKRLSCNTCEKTADFFLQFEHHCVH